MENGSRCCCTSGKARTLSSLSRQEGWGNGGHTCAPREVLLQARAAARKEKFDGRWAAKKVFFSQPAREWRGLRELEGEKGEGKNSERWSFVFGRRA